jgi:hypothetical protein
MRRGLTLVLLLTCLTSLGCGSPATRDALVQAAVATAVVAGEIATAAAEDAAAQAEAKRMRHQQAVAAQSNINQWRLVRRYEPDDDSDDSDASGESDDDSANADGHSAANHAAESSDPDLPVGRCMVCE